MRPIVERTAVVEHDETGKQYTIQPEELSWETEVDERQMGPETHHMGTVSHDQLGELTWSIWEYPTGVLNSSEPDVRSHKLVSDFAISLESEAGEPWE